MIRNAVLGIALLSAAAAVTRAAAPASAPDDAVVTGEALPRTLAEYGFFADAPAQVPAARVTPYRVNTPLWSDGAEKLRFVYIPAGMQAKADGENLLDLAGRTPPAMTGVKATADQYLYLDPKVFAADFAADVPAAEAEFMAASQVFPSKASFEAKISEPAWKTKRSWALIATDDRAIHPDLMRTMAKRAGSTVKEVKAAYPTWEAILTGDDDARDYGWVKAPGNSRSSYRIDVDNGRVSSVILTTEGQKCVE